jgi:hypothetical protein
VSAAGGAGAAHVHVAVVCVAHLEVRSDKCLYS